jgi:nucleoid-associated protein YgaU
MKLKEAQMLGILALIAVGIVLLCMWGGGDDLTGAARGDGAAGVPGVEAVDTNVLFRELAGVDPVPIVEVAESETFEIEVGSGELPAFVPSEEAALQDVIEQREPRQIPLIEPPRPEPEERSPVVVVRRTLPPPPIVHTVEPGDTLSELSTKYYGTSRKVKVITDANPDVDPRRMPVGTRLKIPRIEGLRQTAVVAASGPQPALSAVAAQGSHGPLRKYTVQKGDSLYRIAQKFYSDGNKFEDIRLANRDVLSDPDHLVVGMELIIP